MTAKEIEAEIYYRHRHFRAIDPAHKRENLILLMDRDSFYALVNSVEPYKMGFIKDDPDKREFLGIPIIIAEIDNWQLVEKHEGKV